GSGGGGGGGRGGGPGGGRGGGGAARGGGWRPCRTRRRRPASTAGWRGSRSDYCAHVPHCSDWSVHAPFRQQTGRVKLIWAQGTMPHSWPSVFRVQLCGQLDGTAVQESFMQTMAVQVQVCVPASAQVSAKPPHAPQPETWVAPHDAPFVDRVQACASVKASPVQAPRWQVNRVHARDRGPLESQVAL